MSDSDEDKQTREKLLAKIQRAKSEISIAEKELDEAISALPEGARANKTRISLVLEDAFRKVRGARANVGELEVLLTEKDPADK